ncbi:magnesium transporter [Campylobacter sp. RM12327]|uniref:magnesium transporter n=1 Tax=Campylobacter sputorum TaxID=206 RepID=UPI000B784B2E|nr:MULTISPECIES: magnesium transporter [Campylobacter]ASM40471.1 Mg/Co/Ni transporter, MgtE family [Campylobacter sputorum]MBE7357254.1 magnesium transporter [Campylobacter sp. RM11302]MBF6668564.1 magnesium transporter [Campylobacter sp. RM12327]MBF6674181.1 magnesium transporter [Campylobacter sp. RM13538]MBF6675650.1 magnesium transporter [Campylobacter sp. RM12321]
MSEELQIAKEQLDSHFEEGLEDELSSTDIAEYLKTIKKNDDEQYEEYLEKLDPEVLGEVAMEMPDHMIKDVIEILPKDKIVEAIEELESDDQVELLKYIKDIDDKKARELFDELDEEDQADILKLSIYEENEAGAYMQTELFSARSDESLESAIQRLKRLKEEGELEDIYQLFVVDEENKLKYSIPLYDLITCNFKDTIGDIVKNAPEDEYKPHFALDSDNIEDVATDFQEFDLSVLPIVNSSGALVGRITTDDIHDFIQESATEQIYNLAGLDDEAEEEDDTIYKASLSRASWLFLNLVTALLASFVISLFGATIESFVALAILMPIVSGMGGNTGTQALTVTVRKLALGEIEFSDAKYVLKREISIAVMNSVIFGVLLGIVSAIWFKTPMLGVVICSAMIINLSLSGFFGAIIPMTLKKFKIDPAVGSSVLLTTFTDIIGFLSFLGLATWILM